MDDNFNFTRASTVDSALPGLDGTAEILICSKDLRRVTDTVLRKFIPQLVSLIIMHSEGKLYKTRIFINYPL